MKTTLGNRTLWYDGTMEVAPGDLEDFIVKGVDVSRLAVTEVNSDVKQFNKMSPVKLDTKSECTTITNDWIIPDEYKSVDVGAYVVDKLVPKIDKDDPLYEDRLVRLLLEIEEFEKRGFNPLLRILIYVVDVLRKKQIVWGVGRGSSCASYLLYLIGVHCVDPVRFEIPLVEFFR